MKNRKSKDWFSIFIYRIYKINIKKLKNIDLIKKKWYKY